jgi:hypothetical protein
LQERGISHTFENNERRVRGSNIKVAGIQQTERLVSLLLLEGKNGSRLEQATLPMLFDNKCLDLLKMRALYRIVDALEQTPP